MVTVCYCYLWAGSTQKLTRHLVSWSSIMTQRFLAVLDGTRDKESILILMLWWTTCLAGKTISSVLARFSWRWWFFIHVDISARQSEIRTETVVSSGGKDRNSWVHQNITESETGLDPQILLENLTICQAYIIPLPYPSPVLSCPLSSGSLVFFTRV